MDKASQKNRTVKAVFGIAIPILIMVVTLVMVSASFAWFSNDREVRVTKIDFSTAQTHQIVFDLKDSELWDNIKYVGQTAFCFDGDNTGKLMTEEVAGDNSVNQSNIAYYFINTIALDTEGNTFDIEMYFDTAKISKMKVDAQGMPIKDENGNNIIISPPKKTYGFEDDADKNTAPDIPYAFTWFFKKHSGLTAMNYTASADGTNKTMAYLSPTTDEVWYTPYGKLTFGSDGFVKKLNDAEIAENYSIKDVDGFEIESFSADGELYDFYIVFAPQKMFWMQFFSADKDVYTAQNVYSSAELAKMFNPNYPNQMYYSSMDYASTVFEFSAQIAINGISEEGGENE